MRILFVDTYYPAFIESFYHQYSGSVNIFSSLFGTANFYSNAMERLGHVSKTIVANNWHTQNLWAKNHLGGYYRLLPAITQKLPEKVIQQLAKTWEGDILLAQIRNFKPDVTYFLDINYFSKDFLNKAKSISNSLHLGQIASVLPKDEVFSAFDLIVSSLPNIISKVKRLGVKTYYQPLAFEKGILKVVKQPTKKHQATHIGGYGPIHRERNKVLEYAARRTPIDFWGYNSNSLSPTSPILSNYHGEAWGKKMYQILMASRLTVTKHIGQVAGNFANNMTLFEATGCGTLLATDSRLNLNELFIPSKEVVTYDSPAELVEKIKYYLEHESSRDKIAKAGQRRTLTTHTYDLRMRELTRYIKSEFKL